MARSRSEADISEVLGASAALLRQARGSGADDDPVRLPRLLICCKFSSIQVLEVCEERAGAIIERMAPGVFAFAICAARCFGRPNSSAVRRLTRIQAARDGAVPESAFVDE